MNHSGPYFCIFQVQLILFCFLSCHVQLKIMAAAKTTALPLHHKIRLMEEFTLDSSPGMHPSDHCRVNIQVSVMSYLSLRFQGQNVFGNNVTGTHTQKHETYGILYSKEKYSVNGLCWYFDIEGKLHFASLVRKKYSSSNLSTSTKAWSVIQHREK